MPRRAIVPGLVLLAGLAVSPCAALIGPDVYVSDLTNLANFGAVGGITAFGVGTYACNAGDTPVNWYNTDNRHPVITQNMYRLMNGRFEQIGQSWAKHGFGSDNGAFCGPCTTPPGGFSQLGVGCSDAYDASTNGHQSFLGPRSQVNATTGVFPYPFSAPAYSTVIDRRLQVLTSDITPAANVGALYFAEGRYLCADDAQANKGLNNASYRQISITSTTATPTFVGSTHIQHPAIQAWQDQDPTVTLVVADYSDGGVYARFWIAAKASDNGNGTWRYEYAVYNHNSARAAGSFSVPVPASAIVSNAGFHAPFSHSGEPYDNSLWTPTVSAGSISFATTPYATNQNANAIRWGTLYNFRFDASAPPVTGAATIGLFTPGTPSSLLASGIPIPGACYPNCDSSTAPPVLNVNDFACFLNKFAAGDTYANCDYSTAAPVLNVNDFACFLNSFAAGCQ